ncbi:MAG: TlpA family protein disulfide reductase [Halioglobus sp.]|nr:TlpA family protein disulfide reductase [Halioglobus sp.]
MTACAPSAPPGNSLPLGELEGQWVVVNYWAIWCKPCAQEVPELNALDKLPGVTVLGVNFDGASGAELAQQLQQLAIRFPTLDADPAAQLGLARPSVLPTTLVLDPGGTLRETLVGPQTLQSLRMATVDRTGGAH